MILKIHPLSMNKGLKIKKNWLHTSCMVICFMISFGQESTPCPPIVGEIKIGSVVTNPQPNSTPIEIAIGDCNTTNPVWQIVYVNKIVTPFYVLAQGDILYSDVNSITPFNGGGNMYKTKFRKDITQTVENNQISINALGIISNVITCQIVQPTTCKSYTLFPPLSGTVNVYYRDCNGFARQVRVVEGSRSVTFCATEIQETTDVEYLAEDGFCGAGALITNVRVDTSRVACISENAEANIGATLYMDGSVTVNTLFTIEASLTQDGYNCSNPRLLQFEIEVLKGNNSGMLEFCIGDTTTRNQTICSMRVVNHNNNVDSIQLNN